MKFVNSEIIWIHILYWKNYDSLVNTGRLNPYVAKLAALLGIVPICGADDGSCPCLQLRQKGMKKAYLKAYRWYNKKKCSDTEKQSSLYYTYWCLGKG